MMMKQILLSAFIDEYSDDLTEQLDALERFGIRYLELRHVNGKNVSEMTDEEIIALRLACDARGIGISAIGSPLGKIRLDGDLDAHLALTERICRYATILGARYVRMFSFYPPQGEEIVARRDDVLAMLQKMLDIADRFGVVLCHENEARIYGDTPERCRDLLDFFGGRLRAVFDMGNFVLEGCEPISAYEHLSPYVSYFHIKDALSAGAIVPAGLGEAEIKPILEAYCANGEGDFFISLEPHLETFAGLNALTESTFTNPYKYDDAKAAFTDAVAKLKALLGGMI